MLFGLLAEATMVLHFAVLAYLALGGFLAWRYRWTLVPHLAMVSWGVLILAARLDCPLTTLEDWARRRAGEPGLPRGFIDTYLTGVIYPADDVTVVRGLVALAVVASWVGLLPRLRSRRAHRA